MNKIVIVGHPQSGFDEVERLLGACGLAPARPSRREGLTPAEINATLSTIHGLPPLASIDRSADLHPCSVGPLWHGLAMDLMLGNMDQALWGWADPGNLPLLGYWRDLDPGVLFVMVYDDPESVLRRLDVADAADLEAKGLARRVAGWTAYNAAMVHFYLRHRDRCVLVHAGEASGSTAALLALLRERVHGLSDRDAVARLGATVQAPSSGAETFADDVLRAFMSSALMQRDPASRQMFEELQAVADLPHREQGLASPEVHALQAWAAMSGRDQRLIELEANLLKQREAIDQHEHTRQAQLATIARQDNALAAGRAELDLMLEQLHVVQMQLEARTLEGQQWLAELQDLRPAEHLANARQVEIEKLKAQVELQAGVVDHQGTALAAAQARIEQVQRERDAAVQEAERQASQMGVELAALRARCDEQAQENARLSPVAASAQAMATDKDELLAQLHRVQEELERQLLSMSELKVSTAVATARPDAHPAHPGAAATPAVYGAAERVKAQLSYRLGATMIRRSRSLVGWLGMPFELLQVVRQFQREQPERAARKLPPLHQYRDAEDGERVKRHLSYRIGHAVVHHLSSPIRWVGLPFALRREIQDFRHSQRA